LVAIVFCRRVTLSVFVEVFEISVLVLENIKGLLIIKGDKGIIENFISVISHIIV